MAKDFEKISAMERALVSFCLTIENTGGVVENRLGLMAPKIDTDWIDLGEAYVEACEALAREPMIDKG